MQLNSNEMIYEILKQPDFTIISKPEGLSCHNGDDSLLQRYGKDWHLVNRIDRETSGIVVLTQKGDLQNALQAALSAGTKTYFTVLRGNLPQNTDVWQEWVFPITDTGEGRDTPQGRSDDRKEAKTLFQVKQSNSYFSAVECRLITGRQHQIRKHTRLAGRPIVGDPRYGSPKDNERISKIYNFHRMALHSWKLEFEWQKQVFTCESPVPAEFMSLFKS